MERLEKRTLGITGLLILLLLGVSGCSFDLKFYPPRKVKLDHGSFWGPATTPYKKLTSLEQSYQFKSSMGGIVKNDVALTEDGYRVYLTNQSVMISFDPVE